MLITIGLVIFAVLAIALIIIGFSKKDQIQKATIALALEVWMLVLDILLIALLLIEKMEKAAVTLVFLAMFLIIKIIELARKLHYLKKYTKR